MSAKPKEITVYVCGTDWQHEIGESGDNVLFESLEALKKTRGCTEECGIVELKARLEFKSWVTPQNLRGVSEE